MLKDLLDLFMRAWLWKVRTPMTKNQVPGKHYLAKAHGKGSNRIHQPRRPAGSKLFKRFNRMAWMDWVKAK